MGKFKRSLKELQEVLQSRLLDKKDKDKVKGGNQQHPDRDDWPGGCSDIVPQ